MKIHVDKVASPPLHSLNIQKVKLAASLLPGDLRSLFSSVHLANQVPASIGSDNRPVTLSMNRLRIQDRGVAESQIVREIFIELAQRKSRQEKGHLGAHFGNRLDGNQLKELNEMADDFVAQYEALAASG